MFYRSYQLCILRIAAEPHGVAVGSEEVAKASRVAEEFTPPERLRTLGRAPTPVLPARAVVGDENEADR